MIVELTDLQSQVDSQIEMRIARICEAEYRRTNFLPNGRKRKKHVPYSVPHEVKELLALRNDLYDGRDPEEISAIITNGGIQDKFLKSKS